MFDLPLHPVVVHFPIVLGILLPLAALTFWWAIKKGHLHFKAWVLIAALALGYGISSYVAIEMGEEDEEKVEEIVSEKVIEEHEEAGELILWVSGGLFLFSLAGLVRKDAVRLGVAILALAAVIPLVDAGHTGGKLVYQYGAANAHLPAKQQAMLETRQFFLEDEDGDKDKDKDKDKDDDKD